MITSQQLPEDLARLTSLGVKFNATSLHQLETFGRLVPNTPVAIRLNVGLGSGYRRGVSVAGPTASFGIWHEHMNQIQMLIQRYDIHVETIHSHIGCGSDPEVWKESAALTLKLIENFPTVTTLNLGGGFKVARNSLETGTYLKPLSHDLSKLLRSFAGRTKRKLHLEIEPGTFLVANAGSLISSITDISDTGSNGFNFIKLDTGMNDIMRPALHASQHPIVVIEGDASITKEYVVVGHNCESTDLLTPSPEDSELPKARLLPQAKIDDLVVIEGVGAYCSSMRLIGYNSFPAPNEVMLAADGTVGLINRKQTFKDFAASEVD